jgi:Zn-finger nucleic acid-binding protein
MKCPQCQQPMRMKTIGGVTIDECRRCRGLWFDHGEIDRVKDQLAPPELHWSHFKIWREHADFKVSRAPLACPRCRDLVLTLLVDRQTGTRVRFCPRCEGCWMTAEDFAGIVNALIAELDNRTASDYLRDSLKQATVLLATRKDPITDWRDLKAVLRLLKYRFFVENPKLDAVMKGLEKSLPL